MRLIIKLFVTYVASNPVMYYFVPGGRTCHSPLKILLASSYKGVFMWVHSPTEFCVCSVVRHRPSVG
jgi:hypothetical protein